MLKGLLILAYLVAVGGMFYLLLTYEEPSHGRSKVQDPDDGVD